ncbi:type II pantothenate kinase [Sporolactobacillus terrae]|uniref:type II pantothenate kinase n=1 Tax=Sporolactobacillus terrae TaxID=269673 RepID=UPI00048C2129|nr:type II pantothenate kinase [Sporolactobacillus terrae]
MTEKIGIDAGGTLIKVALQTEEGWLYRSFPSTRSDACADWLAHEYPERLVMLTGGRAAHLKEKLTDRFCSVLPEFAASAQGARQLLARECTTVPNRFLLTTVGTGTSLNYVHDGAMDWLGGSGVGGGTLMGLTGLLTGIYDFKTLLRYAARGKRDIIDLTVARIYEGEEPPIAGDLTASNFGALSENTRSLSPEDQIASIIGLVAETVTSLSILAAQKAEVDTVIFVGGALSGNKQLKEIAAQYCAQWGITAILPQNGVYCGAIGAACS